MSKKNKRKQADRAARNRTLTILGAIGAAVAGAVLLFARSGKGEGGEHRAPDLAADAPVPGTDRAPVDFRPDPTAPVPESEREALRPATGPAPTLAADRGTVANLATPGNG